MKLYMQVTADKYELPLIVADTAVELGQRVGMSGQRILEYIAKANKHRGVTGTHTKVRYVRVEVEDGD